MKWLNLAGIVLQFLSFWLAAPELLGATTLKRFENGLRKLLGLIPILISLIVICGYGFFFGIMGIVKGINASQNGMEQGEYLRFIITLAIATACYLVFIIFYKRIRNWLDVRIALPLAEKLINNNKIRSTALIVGAILFTIGFVCQFIATLVS